MTAVTAGLSQLLERLPAGVSSQHVRTANGLTMHLLESGRGDGERPLILLMHGFPELAFSWRHILPRLADAGFWVVAPDQRGYGWTSGYGGQDYDCDLTEFTMANLAHDTHALIAALGRTRADAIVGHDFGSPVAATCALIRPDVFPALVMMSAPVVTPPALPRGETEDGDTSAASDVHADLAVRDRPRKHYQWYYSERRAAVDMDAPPQGLHDFLRAYYHMKSADWPENTPLPLSGWTASELAKMPTYYVMDHAATMPESVADDMPSAQQIASNVWLPDADLAIYADAFARTGFQPSLNWYRCRTTGANDAVLKLFSGAELSVPATFIAGAQDWGIEQVPGARTAMAARAKSWRGETLIDTAGHWVQQEQPDAVSTALLSFLRSLT